MARGPLIWTEKKIQEMEAEGYGKGVGANYQPWVTVESFSSSGRSRRIWSPKTNRIHHLLSDVEYQLFLSLEWQLNIVDIREQYPLDRNLTQDVARSLSIRHPFYPGTQVPTVMSVDLLVTKQVGAERVLEAYNAKRDDEAEDEKSLLKLEIQREYFEQMGIPHHVIYHSQIPKQIINNIDWIREALVKPGEEEPRPGYYGAMSARMAAELAQIPNRSSTLAHYCKDFEAKHGLERGTGLRTARMLMHDRILKASLSSFDLAAEPLSTFVVTGQPGKLRAVGGA